jgi:hypothetical protein
MATHESRDARLARLENKLSELPSREIYSAEELDRAEAARASRHFEFAQPVFRTSVKLRFFGDGVRGNDLNGVTAGALIGGVSELVEAAAQEAKIPKQAVQLYLSPLVAPGSTVLELFGPPAPQPAQEKLDTEIDDGPTDAALSHVFALLDTVNLKSLGNVGGTEMNISTRLGNKLFALANDLIDNQIDLNLIWTRPRGTQRTADFTRATAHGFRALLDMENVERIARTETGTLSYISTDGTIGFTYGDKNDKKVSLDASNIEAEVLRGLWATQVRLSWIEETTSHPRRTATKTERTVTAVEPVSPPSLSQGSVS